MMSTTQVTPAAAAKTLAALAWTEVDGRLSADTRRVLMAERYAVAAALRLHGSERTARSATELTAAVTEARRVAAMWGVTL